MYEKSWIFAISTCFLGNLGVYLIHPLKLCAGVAHSKWLSDRARACPSTSQRVYTCSLFSDDVEWNRFLYDAQYAMENGYNIFWSRPGTWTVTCGRKTNPKEPFKESLRNFPFDKTTCKMDIASWLYDSSYIMVGSTMPEKDILSIGYDAMTVMDDTAVEFTITEPVPSVADSGDYTSVASKWSRRALAIAVTIQ